MARSLIANAFFFGSLFVAGAVANPDAAADHSMQEQGHAGKQQPTVLQTLMELQDAKDDRVDAAAQAASLCPAEGKPSPACKAARKTEKQAIKAEKTAQKQYNRAVASAAKQCRQAEKSAAKKCRKTCGKHAAASAVEASMCACTCKDGTTLLDQACAKPVAGADDAPVPMPPKPAARQCCLAGTRMANPAFWRASYPTDSLNSNMPGVVNATTAATSRIDVVCDHKRNGNFAVRHQLSKDDPSVAKSKRCESHSMEHRGSRIAYGQTRYYGMSLYFGPDWAWNPGKIADVLFQWKAFGSGPFMTLQQKERKLVLRIGKDGQETLVDDLDLTQWHDIRMKVHWDTEARQDAIVVQYKTASEAAYRPSITWSGVSMGANPSKEAGGYLKWGLYKSHWQDEANGKITPQNTTLFTDYTERTVWHDNIAVGDSWESVDPAADDC